MIPGLDCGDERPQNRHTSHTADDSGTWPRSQSSESESRALWQSSTLSRERCAFYMDWISKIATVVVAVSVACKLLGKLWRSPRGPLVSLTSVVLITPHQFSQVYPVPCSSCVLHLLYVKPSIRSEAVSLIADIGLLWADGTTASNYPPTWAHHASR